MTKAEWLLKCGWIVDDAAGVVIHVWSLPSWPMMAEGDTPGVEVDAAVRIQTAVIETECREMYRRALAGDLARYSETLPDAVSIARDNARQCEDAYRAEFLPVFTDEATK